LSAKCLFVAAQMGVNVYLHKCDYAFDIFKLFLWEKGDNSIEFIGSDRLHIVV